MSKSFVSTRFLCLWDFPGKNTGMGCQFILQIFPIQGLNISCMEADSLLLSHQGSPMKHSVQFSCSVVSDSLQPHKSQHTWIAAVHHQLPEFTQTHAHQVGGAIQPSHPLSSPSPPAPNPSQHQGPFQWVNSSHEVAKVFEFQLQHQSFQWTPRTDFL